MSVITVHVYLISLLQPNTSVQSISYSQPFCSLLSLLFTATARENLFYPIPAHAQSYHPSNYLLTENMTKQRNYTLVLFGLTFDKHSQEKK